MGFHRSLLFFLLFISSFQSFAAFKKAGVLRGSLSQFIKVKRQALRESPLWNKLEILSFGPQETLNRQLFRGAQKGERKEVDEALLKGALLNTERMRGLHAFQRGENFFINLERAFEDQTPVQAALESGQFDVAKYLLQLGGTGAQGSDRDLISSTAGQGKGVTHYVFEWTKRKKKQN